MKSQQSEENFLKTARGEVEGERRSRKEQEKKREKKKDRDSESEREREEDVVSQLHKEENCKGICLLN